MSNIGQARERRVKFAQWWGNNKSELMWFVGEEYKNHFEEYNGKLVFYPVGFDRASYMSDEDWRKECTLNVMDYIVKKGRNIFIMRKDAFEDKYEIIQEPEMN